MGKRKAAKKPPPKKSKEPLATTFNCLFCNHENAVTCKLDKKAGIGQLQCKVCGQEFQANINYLSHPVDVYSEWVDACDEVANPKTRSALRDRDRERPAATNIRDRREKDTGGGGGEEDDLGDDLGLGSDDDDDDEGLELARPSRRKGVRAVSEDEDEDDD